MPRILCLHGMGISARIFAAQTASFRSLLPEDYEFVFLDGIVECEAAPGVDGFYPGPYLCWYNTPTTSKVARAHKYVLDFVRANGPFDGVMGFSQGAALAASIILHHAIAYPETAGPWRFAIFIGSPVPFSWSLEYGIDTRATFGSPADKPVRPNCPNKVPEYLITDRAYCRGEEALAKAQRQRKKQDVRIEIRETAGEDSDMEGEVYTKIDKPKSKEVYYQMFHPTVDSVRIGIPTAHIIGRKDMWRLHSKDLVGLCLPRAARVFEHGWGHEVPRGASEEICDLVETLVAEAY